MKDYTLTKEEKSKYIMSMSMEHNTKNEPNTIKVKFAGGQPLENIEYSEANKKKIEDTQEKQAAKAVENIPVFKRRQIASGVLTGISLAAVAGQMLYYAPTIQTDMTIPVAGIGVATIASVGFLYKTLKNAGKVKELKTIEYRNENKETLDEIKQHPNALNGISKETKSLIDRKSNPFSVVNIDNYSKKDLETIVDNIDKEKHFGFTYAKTKTSTK